MADVVGILNPLGGVVSAIAQGIDSLVTSDEERLRAAIDMRKLDLDERRIDLDGYRVDADLLKGQQEINKAEAQHASVFVAGWRPALGWMCVFGLGYQYALYPLLTWAWAAMQAPGWIPADLASPPALDLSELMTLLLGMLGLSVNRSWDKHKGKARDTLKEIVK